MAGMVLDSTGAAMPGAEASVGAAAQDGTAGIMVEAVGSLSIRGTATWQGPAAIWDMLPWAGPEDIPAEDIQATATRVAGMAVAAMAVAAMAGAATVEAITKQDV